jgi:hypothetical protein
VWLNIHPAEGVSASVIDQWPDGTVASTFRFRHALLSLPVEN